MKASRVRIERPHGPTAAAFSWNVADYGYDAPYALVIFAVVGAAGTIGAIVAWREGDRHLTAVMSFYAVSFWDTRSASPMRGTHRRCKAADIWPRHRHRLS